MRKKSQKNLKSGALKRTSYLTLSWPEDFHFSTMSDLQKSFLSSSCLSCGGICSGEVLSALPIHLRASAAPLILSSTGRVDPRMAALWTKTCWQYNILGLTEWRTRVRHPEKQTNSRPTRVLYMTWWPHSGTSSRSAFQFVCFGSWPNIFRIKLTEYCFVLLLLLKSVQN